MYYQGDPAWLLLSVQLLPYENCRVVWEQSSLVHILDFKLEAGYEANTVHTKFSEVW